MSDTPTKQIRPALRPMGNPDLKVSFEFFPPKTKKMEETLWSSIKRLEPLDPSFVSVTYGAGGSTRERTHDTVVRVLKETDLVPAAHLTCVAATKAEVDEVVQTYWDAGVRHIVALRGDPPEGAGETYQPHPGGYENAAALVEGIKKIGDFEVSVAAYPEKHPDSPDVEADLDNLKRKIDAGADRAITQFFFDNADFYRYLDKAEKRGIDVPIVPGLIPFYDFAKVCSFAGRCGSAIPKWISVRFEGIEDDPETQQFMAAAVSAEQVIALSEHGITDFHFYTLNKAKLVYAVCRLLGLHPKGSSAPAEALKEAS